MLAQVVHLLVVLLLSQLVLLLHVLRLRVLGAALADTHEASRRIHASIGTLLTEASVTSRKASQTELSRAEALLRELDLHSFFRLFEFSLLYGQELVSLALLQLLEYLNALLRRQLFNVLITNLRHWVRQVQVELKWQSR